MSTKVVKLNELLNTCILLS